MSKNVLIVLADGFEEIEALTSIDVLRRADLRVTTAGLKEKMVTGAHGVRVEADTTLANYKDSPDCVVLPGGMPGAKNLGESKPLSDLIKKMNDAKKMIGAICAAPALALAPTGVLNGKRATCYPGFEGGFAPTVKFLEDRVVTDGHVVTSRGPGTALEFSLALVSQLVGREKAEELRKGMLVKS